MKKLKLVALLPLVLLILVVVRCKKTSTQDLNCVVATGFTSSKITNTSATLSWTAALDASQYVVDYRVQGTSTWTGEQRPKTTTVDITGLTPGKTYEWEVQSNCPGANSNFAAIQIFVTPTQKEFDLEKKWKINYYRLAGIPFTINTGDFMEFIKGGTMNQQYTGAAATAQWAFNTSQTQLIITDANAKTWGVNTLSASQVILVKASTPPSPQDSLALSPY